MYTDRGVAREQGGAYVPGRRGGGAKIRLRGAKKVKRSINIGVTTFLPFRVFMKSRVAP